MSTDFSESIGLKNVVRSLLCATQRPIEGGQRASYRLLFLLSICPKFRKMTMKPTQFRLELGESLNCYTLCSDRL